MQIKLTTFVFFICLQSLFYSQDIITKNDASDIETVIKEITIDAVKYVKYSNQDGPLYTISKFDIFRIKYSNGEVETFNNKLQSKQAVSTDLERNVANIIRNNERHRVNYNIGKFMALGGGVITIIGNYEAEPIAILIGAISSIVGEIIVWSSHGWFGSRKIETKFIDDNETIILEMENDYLIDTLPSQTNKTFLTKEDTKGYRETNLSYRYYKKEKVIYKINNQFYKGTVYEKSSSKTVKVYNISKKINGKWILEETGMTGATIAFTIEISAIRYMKQR
jgi:hypothetical protein